MEDLSLYKTNCKTCAKEIDLYQARIISNKKYYRKDRINTFCSLACSGIARRKDKKVTIKKRKIPNTNIVCKVCNKNIEFEYRSRIFCSIECRNINETNKRRIKNNICCEERTCYTCKKIFMGYNKAVFCSDVCSIPKSQRYKELSAKIKNELITLKGNKCKHCSQIFDSTQYCFHHRNPKDKKFTLDRSNLLKKSKEDILNELEKCDLYCHNCHAILHCKNNVNKNAKNKKRILIEKAGGKCCNCGWTSDIEATFSFDHIGEKRFPLDICHIKNISYEELLEEIKNCMLLCMNCHINKNTWQNRKTPLVSNIDYAIINDK